MRLIGYTGRDELRYAIDSARERPNVDGDTLCHFSDEIPVMDTSGFLDLKPWMDSTPFTVHPQFPMEMVLEIFKKMGLRYVLITVKGRLVGLITKKDLLRHLRLINFASETMPRMDRWTRATG